MELEELKSIWKSSEPQFQPKAEIEIASMLKRKSFTIIDKLKRNVWLELIFTLVVSAGLLVYALTLPVGGFKWNAVCILIAFMIYTVAYIKKLIVLNRFNPANENIRANLIALHETLSGYLRFYKRSYTLLYPIFFILFLVFIGIERGAEKFVETISRPFSIIGLLGIAVAYYLLSTKFADWYLAKLYGNHIEKLKNLLDDLQG